MKAKILGDFQICISVPLKGSPFFPMFFFIPLKTSKPKVLCFQGDQKGALESKRLVKHHVREYKRFLEYLVCIPMTGANYIQGLQKINIFSWLGFAF